MAYASHLIASGNADRPFAECLEAHLAREGQEVVARREHRGMDERWPFLRTFGESEPPNVTFFELSWGSLSYAVVSARAERSPRFSLALARAVSADRHRLAAVVVNDRLHSEYGQGLFWAGHPIEAVSVGFEHILRVGLPTTVPSALVRKRFEEDSNNRLFLIRVRQLFGVGDFSAMSPAAHTRCVTWVLGPGQPGKTPIVAADEAHLVIADCSLSQLRGALQAIGEPALLERWKFREREFEEGERRTVTLASPTSLDEDLLRKLLLALDRSAVAFELRGAGRPFLWWRRDPTSSEQHGESMGADLFLQVMEPFCREARLAVGAVMG